MTPAKTPARVGSPRSGPSAAPVQVSIRVHGVGVIRARAIPPWYTGEWAQAHGVVYAVAEATVDRSLPDPTLS